MPKQTRIILESEHMLYPFVETGGILLLCIDEFFDFPESRFGNSVGYNDVGTGLESQQPCVTVLKPIGGPFYGLHIHDDDSIVSYGLMQQITADTDARQPWKLHIAEDLRNNAWITREADAVCYLQAGPEVAVASTKAFTSQVAALALVTLRIARLRNLSILQGRQFIQALRMLPHQIQEILDRAPEIERLALWDNKSEKLIQQNHPDIGKLFFDQDGEKAHLPGHRHHRGPGHARRRHCPRRGRCAPLPRQ